MSNNMDIGTNWEGFIKTLLQRLDMPTKEDILLEQLIQKKQPRGKKQPLKRSGKRKSASGTALKIIANYPEGTDFKTIKEATGFDDKKLRNIIYRLEKLERIRRVRRGIYQTT